jgi:cation-transporting ATPase E
MNEPVPGLSQQEVAARVKRGQVNAVSFESGRTYFQIFQKNAFTFINSVLFAISLILIIMRQYGNAFVTGGLILFNVVITVYQEVRAKRKLERIALLVKPKSNVIRGGKEVQIDQGEIVIDDVLHVQAGDQIAVDGEIIATDRLEVDESLITGEADRLTKKTGDLLYSGSFCTAGSGYFQAKKVGADNLINQLTSVAHFYVKFKTPLQRDIDYIIRVLVLIVGQLGLLIGISVVLQRVPLVESVSIAAVIVALVPQGLFFMTTVAYAMGAVRVAGKGALIQESNAIESISNVNLLCLDKTGTITTNRLKFYDMVILDDEFTEQRTKKVLGDFAASVSAANRTIMALREAFAGEKMILVDEVPFSSELQWSAITSKQEELSGSYLLGAPEILGQSLPDSVDIQTYLAEWMDKGYRTLMFARSGGAFSLHDQADNPQIPQHITPLCLLAFKEELRPEMARTLEHFASLGIQVKIISGDHPGTVAALARQVGMPVEGRVLSGTEVDGMDDDALSKQLEEVIIFGRITPQQKQRLIRLFQKRGYYVAMIGDGVNDVLPLKQAQVGVSMQSGSQATRSAADIILLNDSFASLPVAFQEGQRIVKGMEDVVRLLLTRTIYVLMLVIATRIIGVAFPVTPKDNSILALLTVGIPILAIAAWARPGKPVSSIVQSMGHFVYPAAATISLFGLVIFLVFLQFTGEVSVARSALTSFTILCGLLLVPFVEPPNQFWVGGDEYSGDRRPSYLALGMLVLYILILFVPPLRSFFGLYVLKISDYGILFGIALVWGFLQRWIWRQNLYEKLMRSEVQS